jgi:hypothetical protein
VPLTRSTEGPSEEPGGEATTIAAKILDAAEGLVPDGWRVLVAVNDDEQGGLGISGYAGLGEVMTDLLGHLESIGRAHGIEIHTVPLPDGPPQG